MRVFMPPDTVKWLISVCAVLVVVGGVGLLISGGASLYGQVPGARIPNMVGTWDVSLTGCIFPDVWDPLPSPNCAMEEDTEITFTTQNGRLFAGSRDGDKYTGVILPDGTVSVQVFDPSPDEFEHIFATGTLSVHRGTYVMSGYAHHYQELNRVLEPWMATTYFYATKR